MRLFRSKGKAPDAGPSTVVGGWLRALLLDQRELTGQLTTTLNYGKPGWNDDEPAVVEALCEIAVREYFGADYDVRAITSFVSRMRSRVHSVEPPGQLAAEAVIRFSLGETDVVAGDVKRLEKLGIRIAVLAMARLLLGWDEATVDQRIVEAGGGGA